MVNEVIPLEDVSKVITDFTNKDFERAIVLLLLHGMSAVIIRNLKIKDLLTSCSTYFEEDEITLEQLLAKDPLEEEMIAFWDVSGSNPHFLCSGPQALFFIFQHLQRRIEEGMLQFDQTDDYLLVNTAYTQLDEKYVTNWLIPKRLKDIGINSHFRAGNLNYTFEVFRNQYLPDNEFKNVTIKLFEGKYIKKFEKRYLNRVLEDNTIFINQFKEILPYLTVELDYDSFTPNLVESPVKTPPIASNNFDTSNNSYSNDEIYFIIKDFYKNHNSANPSDDYDRYGHIINSVFKIAKYHNERGYLKLNDSYLEFLFNYVEIELLFSKQDVKIEYGSNTSSDDVFGEVMDVIYDIGVTNFWRIDENAFKDIFFTSLYHYHEYDDGTIIIGATDILDALYMYYYP